MDPAKVVGLVFNGDRARRFQLLRRVLGTAPRSAASPVEEP